MSTKKKQFGHKDYRIKPTYIGLSLVRIIDYAAVVKAIKRVLAVPGEKDRERVTNGRWF